jgi:hypothetical protein
MVGWSPGAGRGEDVILVEYDDCLSHCPAGSEALWKTLEPGLLAVIPARGWRNMFVVA